MQLRIRQATNKGRGLILLFLSVEGFSLGRRGYRSNRCVCVPAVEAGDCIKQVSPRKGLIGT